MLFMFGGLILLTTLTLAAIAFCVACAIGSGPVGWVVFGLPAIGLMVSGWGEFLSNL